MHHLPKIICNLLKGNQKVDTEKRKLQMKIAYKKYYEKNKKKCYELAKEWRKNNPDKVKKYNKKYNTKKKAELEINK